MMVSGRRENKEKTSTEQTKWKKTNRPWGTGFIVYKCLTPTSPIDQISIFGNKNDGVKIAIYTNSWTREKQCNLRNKIRQLGFSVEGEGDANPISTQNFIPIKQSFVLLPLLKEICQFDLLTVRDISNVLVSQLKTKANTTIQRAQPKPPEKKALPRLPPTPPKPACAPAPILPKNLLKPASAPITISPKDFQRREKKKIIDQGALTPLPPKTISPTAIQAIESILFLGEQKNPEFYRKRIAEQYQLPLLQPLLNLAAYYGFKKITSTKNKIKFFKVIGVEGPSIRPLRVTYPPTSGTLWGLYPGKNSVFVALSSPEQGWPTILHEIAHAIMGEVFKYKNNPFKETDTATRNLFNTIIATIQRRFCSLVSMDPVETQAINIINNTFSVDYTIEQYASELIVKVPEIIGLLGNERGMEWLNKYTPELVKFYEEHVNKAFNDYLKDCEAQKYISIRESTPPPEITRPSLTR